MIYITGDTHGNFNRLSTSNFPQGKSLTKSDYVIVCGDFGIWDQSKEQRANLNWLNEKNFTTLFIDGNHSNFDLLKEYNVLEWNGGNVHYIRPTVIHLMRGQVYEIDGHKIFTMGGAQSHDIHDGILDVNDPDLALKRKKLKRAGKDFYRIKGLSWWPEELPSETEYSTAIENLSKHNWKVDYIFSHCCPSSVQDILSNGCYQQDKLTNFLEGIKNRCEFKSWFFGHYHDNRQVMSKYYLLYKQIASLNDIASY